MKSFCLWSSWYQTISFTRPMFFSSKFKTEKLKQFRKFSSPIKLRLNQIDSKHPFFFGNMSWQSNLSSLESFRLRWSWDWTIRFTTLMFLKTDEFEAVWTCFVSNQSIDWTIGFRTSMFCSKISWLSNLSSLEFFRFRSGWD